MIVEVQVTINAPITKVWATMTNIENTAGIISGIQRIEVVERPAGGLVGFKWRETRMLFGKPATIEKWITEAKENVFYTTRAEDGGFVFLTTHLISMGSAGITLKGIHQTLPQGFAARLKALPLVLFKTTIKKAIMQDLNDIKSAVEHP
ncbi:SRPBCC family protein [Leptospira sp. 201903071]|uniref:SRPBCC family protein n=1 Tax=Leptospira ainazelensis TaxID=2810034 RepID=UPI001964047C|nr:SRPBCC family protein [Leptospira ainazelensis]MBM9500856.1 SRPBCC family protein [Leptospira ainazelensis]